MSKFKGPMTAEELMAKLANDPEYQERRRRRDDKSRRRREYHAELVGPILERLRQAGFAADSIQDAVKQFAPLPQDVVDIILASLETCPDNRIRESLIRALAAAAQPFDGRLLVKCYDTTKDDEGVRFAILNTIALIKPYSIEDWLVKAGQNSYLRQKLADLGYRWKDEA